MAHQSVSSRESVLIFVQILAGIIMFTWSSAQAGWQQSLSDEETDRAATIALSSPVSVNVPEAELSVGSRTVRSTERLLPDPVDHPLGVQILLVELREKKNSTSSDQRLAEVFLYNYPRRTTELHLIDIDHGVLIETTDIENSHLPLSDKEIEYSKQLAFNDDQLTARINHEIDRLQGVELSGLQQRVSIWVPTTSSAVGASSCDVQRCALLSLFTADEQSLVVEPVVNLISGDVFIDLVQ